MCCYVIQWSVASVCFGFNLRKWSNVSKDFFLNNEPSDYFGHFGISNFERKVKNADIW